MRPGSGASLVQRGGRAAAQALGEPDRLRHAEAARDHDLGAGDRFHQHRRGNELSVDSDLEDVADAILLRGGELALPGFAEGQEDDRDGGSGVDIAARPR